MCMEIQFARVLAAQGPVFLKAPKYNGGVSLQEKEKIRSIASPGLVPVAQLFKGNKPCLVSLLMLLGRSHSFPVSGVL